MEERTLRGPESSLEDLLAEHVEVFARRFGAGGAPKTFYSPGRVNLMGGHLDYNGGPVMPTAIDRGTFIVARRRPDRRVRIGSTLDATGLEFEISDPPSRPTGRWVDYPLGVFLDLLARVGESGGADDLEGLDLLFGGNLRIGAGLSSSASMCVGTAAFLDRLWRLELGRMDPIESALRAERGFVGVQCGIMDPFAVGLARPGHLLWLDCKDRSWEHLPIDYERVSIAIADSGVQRELAAGEFNRRVEQCARAFEALRGHAPGATCLRDVPADVLREHASELEPDERRRAEHVVAEVARTFSARDALLDGDLAGFGARLTETHASLRELYDVSCPELDVLVEAAVGGPGVLGARLTGAGFGGCVVMLVERGREDEVEARVASAFEARFGRRPTVEVYAGDAGPREIAL